MRPGGVGELAGLQSLGTSCAFSPLGRSSTQADSRQDWNFDYHVLSILAGQRSEHAMLILVDSAEHRARLIESIQRRMDEEVEESL